MPPKKVKRGGPRENAGRKVDSTGEYSKARTPEERRRADRENKAKLIHFQAVVRPSS